MKKLFGGLEITWKKLILSAVCAGIYTGIVAMIPQARDTSFADISITFEWWVLFGILIIVNSKSALDSGLKCIVFFLISQPLVYLVQVPFNALGWGLFKFYKGWFIWTLFTFPMGYIGWYMKKEKWWSLGILSTMLLFVGYHYHMFLRETVAFFPHHLLSTLFCAATVILYPLCIFEDKKLKKAGVIISVAILIAMSCFGLMTDRAVYETDVLLSGGSHDIVFDDTYTAYLADEDFGTVEIVKIESLDDYGVHVKFSKLGDTELVVESPDGAKRTFRLHVERDTYTIEEVPGGK